MDTLIIGIAGGSGSGKTTLAEKVASHFGEAVLLLRHDDYYRDRSDLSYEERCRLNYDHPAAFDNDLLISHLDALRRGESVSCPIYDYGVHNRAREKKLLKPASVIILEGILIFENDEITSRLDIKVFVDTDADVRIIRRIMRDVKKRSRTLDSVIDQYLTTVKPMHDAFVEPTKKKADIIIPEGGKNPIAYGILTDKIEKFLAK